MATTATSQSLPPPGRLPAASDKRAATTTQPGKRGKGKKAADPVNTSKAIEDTIALLERNKAGDKEQELEIEREVKRANRDLSNLLSTLETPMSRSDTVQRKYTELLTEMKRTEREYIKTKKRADQLQKDKDQKTSELNKMTTVKEKLEKLCRELQKENKKLKDDNKRVCDTETRMREELHEKLEGMVLDVEELIEQKENPESLQANQETDEIFRQKFKSFIDQYELRELQFHSLLRTKELEVQYQIARYEQQRKAQEQEATKSRQLTSQVSTFSQTETELRSQLNIYVEKFKQVEDTLNNSNDLFLTFRKEMEEMSKKTKRLEKENHNLTRKHELTNHNILQMAEERTKTNKEMEVLRKKNENLEKLCRGMQQQGRGQQVPGMDGQGLAAGEVAESEGTESEYEYDDEEDEEEDEDASGGEEYDEDTEEEAAAAANSQQEQQQGGTAKGGAQGSKPVAFGPPPPPPTPTASAAPAAAAKDVVNGKQRGVNGVKH